MIEMILKLNVNFPGCCTHELTWILDGNNQQKTSLVINQLHLAEARRTKYHLAVVISEKGQQIESVDYNEK